MATFHIDQAAEQVTIIPVAEAEQATVWEPPQTEGGQWTNTGEPKKDANGTQLWNVRATVLAPGSAKPVAEKIVIASETKPEVTLNVPSTVDGLGIVVRQAQVTGSGIRPVGAAPAARPAGPKGGDA